MLNRRHLVSSLIVIGLLALMMGWGTYAYFSDTGYSEDNTVSSGTLDIKLWGEASPAGWFDNVTATWSVSDFAPNQTKTETLSTKTWGASAPFGITLAYRT